MLRIITYSLCAAGFGFCAVLAVICFFVLEPRAFITPSSETL